MSAAEAARPLARPSLAQRALRRILSRLAGFTPGVFYYSRDLRAKINDTTLKISLGQPGSPSSLNSAMLALCCALDTELTDVGDRMECEITGAENRGKDAGCWHVVITRLPDSGKEGR